jgi:hypothetical protein
MYILWLVYLVGITCQNIKTGVNCLELNILWGFAKETYKTHSSQTSRIYETRITTKKYRNNATNQVTALAPGGNIHVRILTNSIINSYNKLQYWRCKWHGILVTVWWQFFGVQTCHKYMIPVIRAWAGECICPSVTSSSKLRWDYMTGRLVSRLRGYHPVAPRP